MIEVIEGDKKLTSRTSFLLKMFALYFFLISLSFRVVRKFKEQKHYVLRLLRHHTNYLNCEIFIDRLIIRLTHWIMWYFHVLYLTIKNRLSWLSMSISYVFIWRCCALAHKQYLQSHRIRQINIKSLVKFIVFMRYYEEDGHDSNDIKISEKKNCP